MKKNQSKKTGIYPGACILSVLLTVLLLLNTTVFAYADEADLPKIDRWPPTLSENTEKTVSENTLKVKAVGKNDPQGIRLTELVLTDLDEPAAEKTNDKTATVTSHEKISWDVPVYWIDSNGRPVDQPKAGQECLPLIVFYVPDGYVSDGLLELTPYLSDVFRKAGGVLSVVDHALGVTYITAHIKDSNIPEPAVSKSAEKTDDRTECCAEDSGLKEPQAANEPDTTETVPPSKEPEQSDDSGETEEPTNPEVESPVDEPEEPDPYVVFAEKYREDHYRHISWDEELEAFGGLDQIDLVRLIRTCGYVESGYFTSSISGSSEKYLKYLDLINAINSAREEAARQIYEQADPYIKAHTSDAELVANSNQENLSQFFHMLIDSVIPQAVQLLKENFPAFSAAEDESFSRELGLDIVYQENSAGRYQETSFEYSDDYYIHFTVPIDAYKDNTGPGREYTFALTEDEYKAPYLKQVILHELMHVFMSDYNRNSEMQFAKIRETENGTLSIPGIGEVDPSDQTALYDLIANPQWFSEGVASLCGTPFAENDWLYSYLHEDEEEPYTASGLYEFSQSMDLTMDSTDYSSYYSNDMFNSYIFGPLAAMYMGELYNRKTTGTSTVLTNPDGSVSIDTIAVRNGISAVMERMHNGETMDSVIADISDGKYSDTQDLCKNYFDMDGPNMDSLGFAANVLNYVDALSKENGEPVRASILKPFDENILDLIDLTKSASSDIYVIQDGPGFVKSTVPDEIAYRTGTKSDPSQMLVSLEEQNSNATLNGSGVPAAKTESDPGSGSNDFCSETSESSESGFDALPDIPASEIETPEDSTAECAAPGKPVTEIAEPNASAAETAAAEEPTAECAAPGEPAAEFEVPDAPVCEEAGSAAYEDSAPSAGESSLCDEAA